MTVLQHSLLWRILLFYFSIAAVFIACRKISEPQSEIIIKDGLIYALADSLPYSGLIKDTINGKIVEYEVITGKKNGLFKTYFNNGNLEMSGRIENNLNQGKWYYYYPSGQIESEGFFKDDLPDGVWKWYYENGNLKEEGTFKGGNREGNWIRYDINGSKIEEKYFINNQPKN